MVAFGTEPIECESPKFISGSVCSIQGVIQGSPEGGRDFQSTPNAEPYDALI